MDNTCVVCGAVIPEGRQVCPTCEQKHCGQPESGLVMAYLLRQSVLKGLPGGEKIILHGQFTGDILCFPKAALLSKQAILYVRGSPEE